MTLSEAINRLRIAAFTVERMLEDAAERRRQTERDLRDLLAVLTADPNAGAEPDDNTPPDDDDIDAYPGTMRDGMRKRQP